jgi:anti-sigma B factor antagonist
MESDLPLPVAGTTMFGKWKINGAVDETRIQAGEMTVQVVPAGDQMCVTVAGRVTVESSPALRSMLLDLLRRNAAPVIVIDLSAVSYLDMSGIATLLETLKAARERLVKLRLTGMNGQSRKLAEIAQLDTIFRTSGSEVEFR